MNAEVIPFPQPEPKPASCFDCIYVSLGSVTYCSEYQEEIMDERTAAEDCESFETWDDD